MTRPKKRKTGGRTKGTPNKVTTAFKSAVLAAFDNLGGEDGLTAWARENQTEFYKIAARLIPHEVVGPGDAGAHLVRIVHEQIAPTHD